MNGSFCSIDVLFSKELKTFIFKSCKFSLHNFKVIFRQKHLKWTVYKQLKEDAKEDTLLISNVRSNVLNKRTTFGFLILYNIF